MYAVIAPKVTVPFAKPYALHRKAEVAPVNATPGGVGNYRNPVRLSTLPCSLDCKLQPLKLALLTFKGADDRLVQQVYSTIAVIWLSLS